MLLDTHYHLDFLPTEARATFLSKAAAQDVEIVAQTLTPSGFVQLTQEIHGLASPPPRLSLGFHPWNTASETAARELETFADSIGLTRFVGEIGMDLGRRGPLSASHELQQHVVARVLEITCNAAISSSRPYVLSLHAVRSADVVLDLLTSLDVAGRNVIPIFHWFTGTSDDLTRLIRLGGYISVNPEMLASKRGRAYIKQVPPDRLLLESDLPTQPVTDSGIHDHAVELIASLTSVFAALCALCGKEVAHQITETQDRLYGRN